MKFFYLCWGTCDLPTVTNDLEGRWASAHFSKDTQAATGRVVSRIILPVVHVYLDRAVVAWYLWLIGAFAGNKRPLHWLATSAITIICNQQSTKEG